MLGQAAFTLFRSLPEEVMESLLSTGSIRDYADKQLIYSRGDCDRELNIVDSGAVRVSNVDMDGRRTESAVLEVGDSFGEFTLFAGTPRFFDFHAQGDTRIRTIDLVQFDALMQSSVALRNGVLKMLTHRLLFAVGLIEDIRRLPIPAQLAKYLLQCCEKSADNQWLYRGTQSEVADVIGVSRVSIGHALKSLKEAKLIRTGYGCIHIENKAALQRWVLQQSSLHPL